MSSVFALVVAVVMQRGEPSFECAVPGGVVRVAAQGVTQQQLSPGRVAPRGGASGPWIGGAERGVARVSPPGLVGVDQLGVAV